MRRFISRALVALALVLFPAAASADPISEKTVLAIPHYPDEECGDVVPDKQYLTQVCTTTALSITIERWAYTAYPADDGWEDSVLRWTRRSDDTEVGMVLRKYPKITYFARNVSPK